MAALFNKKFIIVNTKEDKITKSDKTRCKVLRFSSDYNYGEILLAIMDLKPNDYPNLYFFVFEDESIENIETLQRFLIEFSKNRPMVIQVTSEDDDTSKFYYKEENSETFLKVNHKTMDLNNLESFPAFFSKLMSGRIQSIDDEMIEGLISHQTSSLIWRVLRSMELPANFIEKMILKCTANGTKDQLMNILDISFEQRDILTSINDIKLPVLLIAVQNKNESISKFLINSCMQLPYDQQIEISTVAYETNQLEILTDLLNCDFPFPKNFDSHAVTDLRLGNIIDSREEFFSWIVQGNITNIQQFIKHNSTLKNVYNALNYLALDYAFDCRRIKIFHYLKSLGFRGIKNHDFTSDATTQKELQAVTDSQLYQRRKNVSNAVPNERNSVLIMLEKSYIHNDTISEEIEATYRRHIEKWFRDIYKTKFGLKLLDAASQCNGLKLYFDFKSDTVDSIDLNSPNSMGVTYRDYKRIIIGAESSAYNNREQKIKGIIIHEICHYVLGIVYENKEKPYYEEDEERIREFEEIVDEYRKYGDLDQNLDDECGGSIRTLYRQYAADLHHIELIVLAAQMQVEFDDNEEKLKHLQEEKYNLLFSFFEIFILPELETFNLEGRQAIRDFNRIENIQSEMEDAIVKISASKEITFLSNNRYTIVTTNVPKLLLIHAYNHLKDCYKSLFDAKNVFITPEITNTCDDFKEVLCKSEPLNVFVDCSKENKLNLTDLIFPSKSNFIFIVSCDDIGDDLARIFNDENINVVKTKVDYSWRDLTRESQDLLLKTKVNFQNNPTVSLLDLIPNETVSIYDEIIDYHTLKMLIENVKISLNSNYKNEIFDKHYPVLFRSRSFIKINPFCEKSKPNLVDIFKNYEESEIQSFSPEQLLENIKNNKCVVISDIAGSGKSWALKSIADLLRNVYPNKWTTCVDLKDFIYTFKSVKLIENFETFMITNILNFQNCFDSKMFIKLYENGNMNILFDGFDEIAPDFTDFVIELIKSFKYNNSNHIWITTRDYFEEELAKKLKLDAVYKLQVFTQEENIDMLTSNLILNDLLQAKKFNSIVDVKDGFKSLPNYMNYQRTARECSQEIFDLNTLCIGLPFLYKLVAEIMHDTKTIDADINVPKVYVSFINIQYLRWSHEKGLLRKDESVKQLFDYIFNYRELHQLFGMKSLFPKRSKFCDLDIADCEWSDEEIVACGILNKIGDKIDFLHETFREYFVADFIIRIFYNDDPQIVKQVCGYLITFLTIRRFGVVKMFLDEAFADKEISDKIAQRMQLVSEILFRNKHKLVNLSEIFELNLQNLGAFIIDFFKHGSYENVTKIIDNNKDLISSIINNSKMFENLQDYMLNSLTAIELKKFIIQQNIIQELLKSPIDIESIEKLIMIVKEKTDSNFIIDVLNHQNENGENLFFYLAYSGDINIKKIKKLYEILRKFVKDCEIIKLYKVINRKGWNIMHVLISNEDINLLKFFWEEIEAGFESQDLHYQFQDLLIQKTLKNNSTILHISIQNTNAEFHETMWKLIIKSLKNMQNLKKLVFQKDIDGDFFFSYVGIYLHPEILEIVLNNLENNLEETDFQLIEHLKGFNKMSITNQALNKTIGPKVKKESLKIIYSAIKMFYDLLEKILSMKYSLAKNYQNYSHFSFLNELMHNKILRNIVSESYLYKRALFEFKIEEKNPFDSILHLLKSSLKNVTYVAEILKPIFDSSDLNLQLLIGKGVNNVTELTMNEIIFYINRIFDVIDDKHNVKKTLKSFSKFCFTYNNSFGPTQMLTRKLEIVHKENFSINNLTHLKQFMANKKIKNHVFLWELLLKTFKNHEDLKKLLTEADEYGDKYIHLLLTFNKAHIIAFTLHTIEENVSTSIYQEILKSRGGSDRNLLHIAVNGCVNKETFHIIWEKFQNICISDQDFLNIIAEVDITNSNVLYEAITFASSEVVEFILQELERIASRNQIRKLLCNLCTYNQNILISIVENNFRIDSHEILWKTLLKYFSISEIFEFITHVDAFGNNVILNAIGCSIQNIIEFTWHQIKNILICKELGDNEKNINLENCNVIIKEILQYRGINKFEINLLKFNWVECKNNGSSKLFSEWTITNNQKKINEEDDDEYEIKVLMDGIKYILSIVLEITNPSYFRNI